jgi:predicted MFS family arabinose efflux permease
LLLWPDSMRTLFLLTAVPGLLVMLLLVFGLREPPTTEPPKERVRLTLAPFERNFKVFLVALVVFTLGNSTDAFLLVRAEHLGVPDYMLPLLWCAFHVLKSVSNLVFGRRVDQFGPRPFIVSGWLIYAGIYLGFGLAQTAWHAWALFMAYAFFYGLTEPAEKTLVANLVGAERKGLAYGWYNFAIGMTTLPASMIFGGLYEVYGALAAFAWGSALALIAVVVLLGVRQGGLSNHAGQLRSKV